ncbi:putative leucine-rich repeat-containing protein DDB_G0290503 [Lepisosteus oculatus]|uniref:putative leucine-rich repeat-containing protein DDB_G0290503 n=1 Tax=Lepisosteus oculatus TaxID=7918 RepID=UPI003715D634
MDDPGEDPNSLQDNLATLPEWKPAVRDQRRDFRDCFDQNGQNLLGPFNQVSEMQDTGLSSEAAGTWIKDSGYHWTESPELEVDATSVTPQDQSHDAPSTSSTSEVGHTGTSSPASEITPAQVFPYGVVCHHYGNGVAPDVLRSRLEELISRALPDLETEEQLESRVQPACLQPLDSQDLLGLTQSVGNDSSFSSQAQSRETFVMEGTDESMCPSLEEARRYAMTPGGMHSPPSSALGDVSLLQAAAHRLADVNPLEESAHILPCGLPGLSVMMRKVPPSSCTYSGSSSSPGPAITNRDLADTVVSGGLSSGRQLELMEEDLMAARQALQQNALVEEEVKQKRLKTSSQDQILASAKRKLEEGIQARAALEQEKYSLLESLDKSRQETENMKMQELSSCLEEESTSNYVLKEALKSEKSKSYPLDSDKQSNQAEIGNLAAELESQKRHNAALQEDRKKMLDENKAHLAKLDELNLSLERESMRIYSVGSTLESERSRYQAVFSEQKRNQPDIQQLTADLQKEKITNSTLQEALQILASEQQSCLHKIKQLTLIQEEEITSNTKLHMALEVERTRCYSLVSELEAQKRINSALQKDIHMLLSAHQRNTDTLNELNSTLEDESTRNYSLQKELQATRSGCELKGSEHKMNQAKIEQLTADLQNESRANSSHEDVLQRLASERLSLIAKIDQLALTVQEEHTRNTSLHMALEAEKTKHHSLVSELKRDQSEIERLTAKLQEKERTNITLQEDMQKLHNELKRKHLIINEMNFNMENESISNCSLRKALDDESSRCKALVIEQRKYQAQTEQLSAEVDEQKRINTALQEDMEKLLSTHHRNLEKLNELNSTLEDESTRNYSLQKELQATRSDCELKGSEHKMNQAKIEQLTADLQNESRANKEVLQRLALERQSLLEKINKLTQTLEEEGTRTVNLVKAVKAEQSKYHSLESEHQMNEAKNKQLSTELEEEKLKTRNLRGELERLSFEQQINFTEIVQLNAALWEKSISYTRLNEALEAEQSRCGLLLSEQSDKQAEIEHLTAELQDKSSKESSLQDHVQQLTTEMQNNFNKIEQLGQLLEEERTKNGSLLKTLEAQRSQYQTLVSQEKRNQAEFNRLADSLERETADNVTLLEEQQSKTAEISKLSAMLEEKSSSYTRLCEVLEAERSQRQMLLSEKAAKQLEIEELTAELQKMKNNDKSLQDHLQHLIDEQKNSIHKIEQLSNALEVEKSNSNRLFKSLEAEKSQCEFLVFDLERKQAELNHLCTALEKEKNINSDNQEALQNFSSAQECYLAKIEEIALSLEEQSTDNTRLRRALEQERSRCQALESEKKMKQAEIDSLSIALQEDKSQAVTTCGGLESERSKCQVMLTELQSMLSEIQELTAAIAEQRGVQNNKHQDLKDQVSNQQSKQTEPVVTLEENKPDSINLLDDVVTEQSGCDQHEALCSELKAKEDEIQKMSVELQEAKSKSQALETQNNMLATELEWEWLFNSSLCGEFRNLVSEQQEKPPELKESAVVVEAASTTLAHVCKGQSKENVSCQSPVAEDSNTLPLLSGVSALIQVLSRADEFGQQVQQATVKRWQEIVHQHKTFIEWLLSKMSRERHRRGKPEILVEEIQQRVSVDPRIKLCFDLDNLQGEAKNQDPCLQKNREETAAAQWAKVKQLQIEAEEQSCCLEKEKREQGARLSAEVLPEREKNREEYKQQVERLFLSLKKEKQEYARLTGELSKLQDYLQSFRKKEKEREESLIMELAERDKRVEKYQKRQKLLFLSWLRAESSRTSLSYQKKFIRLQLSRRWSPERALGPFGPQPAHTSGTQLSAPPRASPRHRFRTAAFVVIAITRMKWLAGRWLTVTQVRRPFSAIQDLEFQSDPVSSILREYQPDLPLEKDALIADANALTAKQQPFFLN